MQWPLPDKELDLPQGRLRYLDSGNGEPIVFIHGLLVNGLVWRKVIPWFEDNFRCIVPELPLGSHTIPMHPDADLSPMGLEALIEGFCAALGLQEVTLVGSDTGGALSQLVAAHDPGRVNRLALAPCDSFEHFLPPKFRHLQWAARVPGAPFLLTQPLRLAALRRSRLGFGLLIKGEQDPEVTGSWLRPFLSSRDIRRDAVKFLRQIDTRYTLEAARLLAGFDRPALLVWPRDDRVFDFSLAERLVTALPHGELVAIDDSYAFVPEDQPERFASELESFIRRTP
ncbi:MAG: alpha/beta fold hydrolase [Thermoleophilaceae bacterium]